MTGIWGSLGPERATDGRYGSLNNNTNCAHPASSSGPARLWVDLAGVYRVQSVTLWNTWNTGGTWRCVCVCVCGRNVCMFVCVCR